MLAALCLAAFMSPVPVGADDIDDVYALWNNLTTAHVQPNTTREGIAINQVDYEKLRADPQWASLINKLANNVTECAETNSSGCYQKLLGQPSLGYYQWAEYYSWWMNMYNIMAVKTMLDNSCSKDVFGSCAGVIKSITDAGHLWGAVWEKNAGVIGGEWYYLDQIELALRGVESGSPIGGDHPEDMRVHACIVCASISCPNLRNEAYSRTPATLDTQMADQFYSFLDNDKKGLAATYTPASNTTEEKALSVELTPILTWFEDDFLHGCYNYTAPDNFKNISCYFNTSLDWVRECLPCDAAQATKYPKFCRASAALNRTGHTCTAKDKAADKGVSCSPAPTFFTYDWDKNGDLTCSAPASRPCLGDIGLIVIIIVFLVLLVTAALFGGVHVYRVKGGWAGIKGTVGSSGDEEKPLMNNIQSDSTDSPDLSFKASAKTAGKIEAIIILVMLIVVFIIFRTAVIGQLCSVLSWINEPAHRVIGMALIAVIYCIATVLLIPGSVLTIASGFLFKLWGIIPVWFGASAGLLLAWLIGRNLLPHESLHAFFAGGAHRCSTCKAEYKPVVKDPEKFHSGVYLACKRCNADTAHRFIKKYKKVDAVIKAVEEKGLLITLLLRLTPVMPFNALNYILALPDIKFWHYAVASTAGILPGSLMYVYLGSAGGLLCAATSGGAACVKEDSNLVVTLITWVGSGIFIIVLAVVLGIIAKRAIAKYVVEDEDEEGEAKVPSNKVVGADGTVW